MKTIGDWPVYDGAHPAIVGLWAAYNECPEAFGNSFDEFVRLSESMRRVIDGAEVSEHSLDEVMNRLDHALRSVAPSVPSELLTRAEAMDYLRVSDDKLFELTAPVGPIPCLREGKRLYYRLADLRSYVESRLTR